MSGLPDVRVGQIWQDNDPRQPVGRERRLRVVSVPSDHLLRTAERPGDLGVGCQVVRGSGSARNRSTAIKLRRFRPTQTGYRLIADV